jgi:23S rRNA-/tRNA-specific pseudouridylate synthase
MKKKFTKNLNIQILYEDDEMIVINKPAFIDSQNSKSNRPSVVDWLKNYNKKNLNFTGLIHRLDFGTSGVMILAKNHLSASKLTKALKTATKTYLAVTFKKLSEYTNQKEFLIDLPIDNKKAFTYVKILEEFSNATLVECTLGAHNTTAQTSTLQVSVVESTGRKHQIRQHLALIGFPLLGDHRYGKKGAEKLFPRPALHAKSIKILGKCFTAPLPDDLNSLIQNLRKIKSLK